MPDSLTPYYLQAMGIESWVLREQKQPCSRDLSILANEVSTCTRCPLHHTRTNTVFARGNQQAKLMIIGEAPGFYEDKQGLPFVGKAGSLLNQMLQSIGFNEEDVYIANVLKCRPPENRDPRIEEITQCSSYLNEQIALVNPSLILALGRFAGQFLAQESIPLNKLRQRLFTYNSIKCMVSYHPAYLLRQPRDKKKAYQDLLSAQKFLTEQN